MDRGLTLDEASSQSAWSFQQEGLGTFIHDHWLERMGVYENVLSLLEPPDMYGIHVDINIGSGTNIHRIAQGARRKILGIERNPYIAQITAEMLLARGLKVIGHISSQLEAVLPTIVRPGMNAVAERTFMPNIERLSAMNFDRDIPQINIVNDEIRGNVVSAILGSRKVASVTYINECKFNTIRLAEAPKYMTRIQQGENEFDLMNEYRSEQDREAIAFATEYVRPGGIVIIICQTLQNAFESLQQKIQQLCGNFGINQEHWLPDETRSLHIEEGISASREGITNNIHMLRFRRTDKEWHQDPTPSVLPPMESKVSSARAQGTSVPEKKRRRSGKSKKRP